MQIAITPSMQLKNYRVFITYLSNLLQGITSIARKRYLLLYISLPTCFITSGLPETVTGVQYG